MSNEVRNLHLLRDGSLLIGLASGILLRLHDNRFERFAKLDFTVNQDSDHALTFVEGGALWIADGKYRWRFDMVRNRLDRFPQSIGFKPKHATRGHDGWIWVGGRSDPIALCRIRSFAESSSCEPVDIDSRNVTAVSISPNGDL